MSEPEQHGPAVGEFAGRSDAALAQLERHAARILLAGALVALNILLLTAAIAMTGPSPALLLLAAALAAVSFLLLHRLASRVIRYTVRTARHEGAVSQLMMQAVESFARQPAGVRGSVEALATSLRAACCTLYMWDPAERVLWEPRSGERILLTAAMARRMNEQMALRRPVLMPDASVASALPAHVLGRDGSRAAALVPMWAAEELLGIVIRRYRSAQEMRRAGDLGLVSGLAALGAVAVGKALVVDREAQRLRDNDLLLRSVHLAGELTHRENLAEYAHQAAEAVGAGKAAIFGLSGGRLRLLGSAGIPPRAANEAGGIPCRSELIRRSRKAAGDAFACRLGDIDPGVAANLGALGFAERCVVQPLHDRDGLIGVILTSYDGVVVSERVRTLLAALGRQVAMTVERGQMMRSIRKRSRHLACTPKLARSLTGQRDPAAVARIAARELHEGFGFERVSIALVGDDRQALQITASAGMLARSGGRVQATPVMLAAFDSLRPYVSCMAESLAIDVPSRLDDPDAPVGCRSQLAVPIVGADHRCVGVIAVYERDPDALGQDDLHMLQTIADQLAGTIEQATLFETLERSYFKTVEALSAALEAKDAYTLDHARSITELSAAVGRRLGMREPEIRDLKLGALLHDIGKIGVPGEILNKPGPLDDDEFEIMKEHTVIGEQIIAPIEFLSGVRPLVLHEHERWDGAGYPHGLKGDDIPLGARIIFVCDAWHAMTSDRPYRRALGEDEARRRLVTGAGSQFDPAVVDAFLEVTGAGEVQAELAVG